MEHDLELISPRLKILEIEVFNIIYNPGNIGKRIFSTQSYPGNSGSLCNKPLVNFLDIRMMSLLNDLCIAYFDLAGKSQN